MTPQVSSKERIARRIARECRDGYIVNLGAGLPTMVAKYLPENAEILIHSENGIIGISGKVDYSERDPMILNASDEYVRLLPGASIFGSDMSFGIMRGGHLDLTVLGTMQVDAKGNLANWRVKGGPVIGMGGAMDLVAGTKYVIVATEHCDKNGTSKIRTLCDFPLTGVGVVNRIVTELAVLDVTPEGLVLKEISPDTSVDEVIAKTEAQLIIAEDLAIMEI